LGTSNWQIPEIKVKKGRQYSLDLETVKKDDEKAYYHSSITRYSASLKQNSLISFSDKSSQKLRHAQLLILAPFITFCKQNIQAMVID